MCSSHTESICEMVQPNCPSLKSSGNPGCLDQGSIEHVDGACNEEPVGLEPLNISRKAAGTRHAMKCLLTTMCSEWFCYLDDEMAYKRKRIGPKEELNLMKKTRGVFKLAWKIS